MRIFSAGVEPKARKEIWKYLLGLYPPGKTAAQRQTLLQELRAEYEQIKAQWTSITDRQSARLALHISKLKYASHHLSQCARIMLQCV